MRDFTVPMKASRAMKDYPTFSVKIGEDYKDKLRRLREAGVDVSALMRPVLYEQIDQAVKQVFKK